MKLLKNVWKDVGPTVGFYAVFVVAIVLLEKVSPSGICTLGLGALLLLLVPFISLPFLLINFVQWRFYYQQKQLSVLLHLLVLGGYTASLAS